MRNKDKEKIKNKEKRSRTSEEDGLTNFLANNCISKMLFYL